MISRNTINLYAWYAYEWASNSFSVLIRTFIFSAYFTTHVASDKIVGTSQWATATAIAGLIIAILSPLLGAIADFGGYRKRWIFVFSFICIIVSALLWFAYPSPDYVLFALACVVIGTVSYEISHVFYNAYLPSVTSPKHLGRTSGIGWGMGPLGGIFAIGIVLVFFIKANPSWLNTETFEQYRICGPFAALWFAVFSIPLFILLPEVPSGGLSMRQVISSGWKEFTSILKVLMQHKNILLYLIARMIYTDGMVTLFAFGGIYAAGTFGFNFTEILLYGVTMTLCLGVGAIGLSWVDDFLGSKRTITFSLILISAFLIPSLFVQGKYVFWAFSLLIAIFIGPVQSASRTLMTKILLPEKTTEMYGLYAVSGKITSFLGSMMLGYATLLFDSQRVGMATILLFFAAGGLCLMWVKEKRVEV